MAVAGSELVGTGSVHASVSTTDAAGNPATATADHAYTVDLVLPDIPVVSFLSSGLAGQYYGLNDSIITGSTPLSEVLKDMQADLPTASFVAENLNFGTATAISNNLGTSGNLATFLGSNVTDLQFTNGYGTTSQAIIGMSGTINLAAGSYTLQIKADDGYQILVDGQTVATADRNQSPTTTTYNLAVAQTVGGLHTVQIVYWDQGGQAVFQASIASGTNVAVGSSSFQVLNTVNPNTVTATVTLDAKDQVDLTNSGLVHITSNNGTDVTLHLNASQQLVDTAGNIYAYQNGIIYLPVAMPAIGASLVVNATVTDVAGNTSGVGSNDYHLPSAPPVTITTDTNHDGYLNLSETANGTALVHTNVTLDATLLSAGGSANVSVVDGGTTTNLVVNHDGTVTGTANGVSGVYSNGVLTLTMSEPGNGKSVAISATQTDHYGNVSSIGSASAVEDITMPAPTLNVAHRADVQTFSTSWETAANTSNTSDPVVATSLEGWTRVDTPQTLSGGSNGFEIWASGDSQFNDTTNSYNTIYAAPGNGNNFLELNDAGGTMPQTIGISHSVATTVGMVYQLSFDYAGRPGFDASYTNVSILLDGVKVASYANTSSATALDWQNVKLDFIGDGNTHTITIETDPTATNASGRGAMIDDISVTGYQGVAAGNAVDGSDTMIALSNHVSASASNSSDTFTLTFSGLSAGSEIVTSTHTYIADVTGNITMQGSELASAILHVDKSFTGDLHIGVLATETDIAGNSTNASQELDLTVLAHSGTVISSDIVDSTAHIISGTSGNDTVMGTHTSGDDLYGLLGNDTIVGLSGNDVIMGGAGNDTLTGGGGVNTFKWMLGDQGTTAAPAADTITDFNTATNGDKLDLRDLLQGEVHTGTNAGNLTDYLHFTYNSTTHATTIEVKTHGQNQGGVDQTITLNNVDLTLGHTLTTDQAIIQDLLTKGKLQTD
ncbi:MAG: type I secretion C-terminal target domain-containing protein [Formivibrio sp.]|nr:type I secretion C-terminal target domain-containing protein [Formivibrio sp.]